MGKQVRGKKTKTARRALNLTSVKPKRKQRYDPLAIEPTLPCLASPNNYVYESPTYAPKKIEEIMPPLDLPEPALRHSSPISPPYRPPAALRHSSPISPPYRPPPSLPYNPLNIGASRVLFS